MSTPDLQARRPTIYDIAKTAGVSHSTVSRFLRFNGDGMKEPTRARISDAIARLNYRPNLAARAMRTHRTGRLAVLLPAGAAISSVHMVTGAHEAAVSAGYEIDAISLAGPPAARTARILQLAEAGLFEGLLALTSLDVDTAEPSFTTSVPVVVHPEYDDAMRGVGDLADATPVAEIISTLAKQGHRTFLHIAGDRAHPTAVAREQAFDATISELGLVAVPTAGGDWLGETAHAAIEALPEDTEVTAVIAANDHLAAAAVRGALDRGWKVPDDISVTGWDNVPVAQWLPPTLTTVDVDYVELGRRAMAHLLATMSGERLDKPAKRLSAVLWRASTGPASSRPRGPSLPRSART